MEESAAEGLQRIRTAEVMGVLCLATDLGMGLPLEHGLQTTLVAARTADRLGLDHDVCAQAYYASLLVHAGCTADGHVTAEIFGGSLATHVLPAVYGSAREVLGGMLRALPDPGSPALVRAAQTARRAPRLARAQRSQLTGLCEVAQGLASGVGAPEGVPELLAHLLERWDGNGPLRRAGGEEIPLAMRVVHVAIDAALQRVLGGVPYAVALLRERAGTGLDPELANCCADHADEILDLEDGGSVWDEVLSAEPGPARLLEGASVDRALEAVGSFADLVSPYFAGHSRGVAALAETAAASCGMGPRDTIELRHAAFVHDLGRVAMPTGMWQRPGPLTHDEREQLRLHPHYTGRVLQASPALRGLAPIAAAHHERLDGSGYPRGARGTDLPAAARVLAAADVLHAMGEPRPHRAPLDPPAAAAQLEEEARAGRLDPDAVAAVLVATGQPAPRIERPSGLTGREEEVIALVARGLQTKEVAQRLGIAARTAAHHLENAYTKIGVSSRAAATLFAIEHGLVAWAERPMAGETARP